MLRCLCLVLASILCLPNIVCSAQKARIAILPFTVPPSDEMEYLKTKIPDIIAKQLRENGAVVIDLGSAADRFGGKEPKNHDEIREFGKTVDVQYVVWGSLNLQQEEYNIDLNIVEVWSLDPPEVFSDKGIGIQSLAAVLITISRDISLKVFKHKKVAKIIVEGNMRVEDDAILRVIKTKPGDIYLSENLSKDLKIVFEMGYFEDIRVESEDSPEGMAIIFRVKERPTIRKIRFKGNKVYEPEEITEEALTINTGSILNIFKINSDIKRIEDLYKDKNYHKVKVTHNVHYLNNNQADLEFVIKEGKKIKIKEIVFEGNTAYSVRKLGKNMKTKKKGFFSWLTSSGDLNVEDLNQDVMRLTSFYHINGFIQARVGEPLIEEKGEWIYVTIKIEEGPQFKVGKIDVEGDLILSKEELIKGLKIGGEKVCNRKVLQDDVIVLTDIYSDRGYFRADVAPRIDKNFEELTADITFIIRKGDPVYFEKIIISGNSKTRDKVIRRELNVDEQDLYSGSRLKRGVRNLYRLDYFEDIKVNTIEGSQEDKVLLKVDVTEKPTGMFTFGAGYSSVENLFGTISVSQRNLFGRGQTLGLKAEVGGSTNTYSLNFTEPWLFDMPLSAGFSVYNQEKEYDEYDMDTTGGSVRFSYPIFDYTRAYISYSYSVSDVYEIDMLNASESVKDLEGENSTSSVSTTLRYDSRDRLINATEGSEYSFTVKYAGGPFGGDIAFTKYTIEAAWFVPVVWKIVWFMHTEGGYITKNSDGLLPDYERFYLGGMNSLRGFDWRDVTPMDPPGDPNGIKVGGNKKLLFNFELHRPLFKESGLVLLVFYDVGNAYDDHEKVDINNVRESWGYGVRWYSPIGPIRLEYARIVNPREGEDSNGNWEFSMGNAF